MRIAIVRDRESSGGGIYNYYEAIRPYLDGELTLVDVGRPHTFYGQNETFLVRFTIIRLCRDWAELAWKLISKRPKVLIVNPSLDPDTGRSLMRDAINVLMGRLLRVNVLVFWRGWENEWCGSPEFPGGTESWICRTYKLATAHIVLATRFKSDLRRWGFNSPIFLETTVAANEYFEAEPFRHDAWKETVHLLYLSRIEVAKGVFELLDAFKLLQERGIDYRLTIAGDGPDLQELKRYAAGLGLNGVQFPGFLSGDAKLECYRSGTIFCFPSYTEGMPNAVLEALAMGLPVISSDAGGLRDILEDEKTGLMLKLRDGPPKKRFDPSEISAKIERLGSDEELRERMSRYNTAYARERFAAPKVADRIKAICSTTTSDPTTLDALANPLI